MRSRVEIRRAGNEVLPLLILGVTSTLLVLGMAYAVQEPDTMASVVLTGQVVFVTLAFGIGTMGALVLGRGRVREADVEATPDGLAIGGKLAISRKKMRYVYVIEDEGRYAVEIEGKTGVTRLISSDRDVAERLGGALTGKERLPTALFRLRKKAHYYLFSTTCLAWIAAGSALVAFTFAPVIGAVLILCTLPPTAWITLKAVPTQIIVSSEGLAFIHPLRFELVPVATLAGGRVVDDNAVRVFLQDGGSLDLNELSDHPRNRDTRTSVEPADRLERSLLELTSEGEAIQATA